MDEKSIRHLLFSLSIPTNQITYTGSKKRTRWLNVSCPFAPFTHAKGTDRNPSFGITINDEGRSNYKCLSCGLKGRLSALPSRLGGYRKKDYSKLHHWAELTEVQAAINRPTIDWEEDNENETDDSAHAERKQRVLRSIDAYPRLSTHPYLRDRGIHWPTPIKLGLRYDSSEHRILFPCFYPDDSFGGFTGRSTFSDDARSKRNPKIKDYQGLPKRELFLGLPKREASGKKIISEGLFDFAKNVQAGYTNSRAILGTALTPEKLDILISEDEPVYFFMDNDLAGWQSLFGVFDDEGELDTTNSWAFNLYTEVPVWIVPYPSTLGKGKYQDPGSMPAATIREHINRAWLFTGNVPVDDMDVPNFLIP